MAVRSIITVDVADAAFNAFTAKWNQYQAALKKQPAMWAAINQHVNATRQTFDEMVVSMAAANVQAKLREKAQEHADRLTRTAADRWQAMARSSREFLRNVTESTISMLKWTSLLGGLVGIGGLWGLDRMAHGVVGRARTAAGLGTTPGGMAAFGANLQTFLEDPQGFLAAAGRAQLDITQQTGLRTAGLTQQQIGGDTTDMAVSLLRALRRESQQWQPAMFATMLRGMHQEGFASPEQLRILRGMTPERFEQFVGQIGKQRQGLEGLLDPKTIEKWQDFVTQLTNAGNTIESVFIKGLVGLAQPFTHLSESITTLITKVMQPGGVLETGITKLGEGIDWLAGQIDDPGFKQGFENFITAIGQAAVAVADFVRAYAPAVKTTANVVGGAATLGGITKDLVTGNIDLMGRGGGLPIKRGAGTITPETQRLAEAIMAATSVERFTSFKDALHQGTGSLHDAGRALDFTLPKSMSAQHAQIAKMLQDQLVAQGINAKVVDEYVKHGLRWTGSHIHVQLPPDKPAYQASGTGTAVKVENATGGNAIVSVNGLKQ